MTRPSPDVATALASLRERWGGAAPRPATEVVGSLALAPVPLPAEGGHAAEQAAPIFVPADLAALGRIVPTGFAALDAILGPGGLPRQAAAALQGDGSSGKTTLALRLAAEVQAAGGIVAYVDLARSLDPVEAVARGVRLEWLLAVTPDSLEEGLSISGALLQDRAVDLLILDLPPVERSKPEGPKTERLPTARLPTEPGRSPALPDRRPPANHPPERPSVIADRLHRLAALARRAECTLLILEPPGLPPPVRGALAESAGLRLELTRRGWIRLGRDVVGQRTEVVVVRNRFGPPGRRAELRILYADGGARDSCLARPGLLVDEPSRPSLRNRFQIDHETSASLLASSAPPPRPIPIRQPVSGWSGRPGRSTLDARPGPRREPAGTGPRRPAGDASRERASAGSGGRVPRS